ncbi:MAG: metallophosphoesterase family protein [Cyclobacteriaceae bacterium]|nr:metallophosphoesterase family protein [Cyclobacteriaceae bacterium]
MRIGILSDTHGWLDERILHHFKDCDEIWHAGDVGDVSIIDHLQQLKPTIGVYGNIDGQETRSVFPETEILLREGLKIYITHIAGTPGRYQNGLMSKLKEEMPKILVCGHSHILKVMPDKKLNNMLYINPGAAGRHGFHKVRTILKLEINNGKIANMQAIELGKRGKILD